MTWSYSGDPSTSDLDAVRFYSGDVLITDPLVEDEEIAFTLLKNPDPQVAGAVVCEHLASVFARMADTSVGDVRESKSQKAKAFEARAVKLRRLAARGAKPIFGAIDRSQKETAEQDTELVQPSFRVGQFDHPEVPSERRHDEYDDWRY